MRVNVKPSAIIQPNAETSASMIPTADGVIFVLKHQGHVALLQGSPEEIDAWCVSAIRAAEVARQIRAKADDAKRSPTLPAPSPFPPANAPGVSDGKADP